MLMGSAVSTFWLYVVRMKLSLLTELQNLVGLKFGEIIPQSYKYVWMQLTNKVWQK